MSGSSTPETSPTHLVELDTKFPIWQRVFVIAPLVLVGTRDEDGQYDLKIIEWNWTINEKVGAKASAGDSAAPGK